MLFLRGLRTLSLPFTTSFNKQSNRSLLRSCASKQTGNMPTQNNKQPVLEIAQGKLLGQLKTSIYDASYYSFEGIPFGKPPVGDLRFKAPLPADGWEGTRDCTIPADVPVQMGHCGEIYGNEDCLYLNVFAKTLESAKPLPVLVWFYGGGFTTGGAKAERYGPDYFMEENVVLVMFNYRLGALGYLCLSDPQLDVPGNAGLKDQVLALRWIKQNISHFNGDAENITLFGESAGAAAVHFMALTPQTKGLFHKAILSSGCALNNWATMPQNKTAYNLACQHGYKGEQVDSDILNYLRSLKPEQLANADILTEEQKLAGETFSFTPTVEPYNTDHCVVEKSPLELMRTAWSNGIPIIIGGNSFEGLLMCSYMQNCKSHLEDLRLDGRRFLPLDVKAKLNEQQQLEAAEKLLAQHLQNYDELSEKEKLACFLDIFSHKSFWHDLHRTVLSRLENASAPTYLYRFDFDSPHFNLHRIKFCNGEFEKGVAHGDDLEYYFYAKGTAQAAPDSAEYCTIRRIVRLWTTFAAVGNPNCDEIAPAIWDPLDKTDAYRALNISHDVEVLELPEKKKLLFWHDLYKNELI